MCPDMDKYIQGVLTNLQVHVIVANYTHCWNDWRDLDYIPDYNKLYYICDGEGWLKIGGREYFPQPGQLFIMPQGVKQSYSAISPHPFTKYWCHFTAKVGEQNLFDMVQLPPFLDAPNSQVLKKLFESLITNSQSSNITAVLKTKAVLLEILAFYMDNTPLDQIYMSDSTPIDRLRHVVHYIETHLGENITVEQLANLAHFHPNYFIRLFKTHLGSSPLHYINRLKLEKAKLLMQSTSMNATEIASTVGFHDLFYFSNQFKKYTGFSPSEYKKWKNDV